MSDYTKLLQAKQTVFSSKELAMLWQIYDSSKLAQKVYRYVRSGKLIALRRGLIATSVDYDRLELATKVYRPAYISLETVLREAGMIFQYSSTITIVSYLSRGLEIDDQGYEYHKIKDAILLDPAGIMKKQNYDISTPERAFLDTVYLHTNYHFDNLSSLDWDRVEEILPIYGGNQRMRIIVNQLRKKSQEDTDAL